MGFREQVSKDIDRVFLRQDEFGEPHEINGKIVPVVLERNAVGELAEELTLFSSGTRGTQAQGLYLRQWTLYAPVAAMGRKPKVGSLLLIDKTNRFRVLGVSDEMGMYTVTLEEVQS